MDFIKVKIFDILFLLKKEVKLNSLFLINFEL